MTDEADVQPVPDALKNYLRNPLPEKFTVEILEDWHAVLDDQLVEFERDRGSTDTEESIIKAWEKANEGDIERRRSNLKEAFGAVPPEAFISANAKMEYMKANGHSEYQGQQVPDSVVEVVQEFIEIITYPDEFEGQG